MTADGDEAENMEYGDASGGAAATPGAPSMADPQGGGVLTSTKDGDVDGEWGRPDTVDVLDGEHGVPWRNANPRSSSPN